MTTVHAQKTDTGRVRDHNEDYVWVDEQAGVYIVADGLGGHEAGEVASGLAATTVGEMIAARIVGGAALLSAEAARELLTDSIETANEKVSALAEVEKQDQRMGTVIVVALVRPPIVYDIHIGFGRAYFLRPCVAYISHAGDARAYLVRGSAISLLTEDDSLVAQLVADGAISEVEAREHPQRNLITKMVGQDRPVQPSFAEVALEAGDWLLLCSDGLWGMVDDEAILGHLLEADGDPARVTEALISAANAAGGRDNISVVAIRVPFTDSEGEA
jgi:serine/threonine protein phosphatase PrpC